MYCYFSVHFNDTSENGKLKSLLNWKIKLVQTMLIEKYFLKDNI